MHYNVLFRTNVLNWHKFITNVLFNWLSCRSGTFSRCTGILGLVFNMGRTGLLCKQMRETRQASRNNTKPRYLLYVWPVRIPLNRGNYELKRKTIKRTWYKYSLLQGYCFADTTPPVISAEEKGDNYLPPTTRNPSYLLRLTG